ncbi:hypothetical protein AGOR_G00096040 [Albula goreensis]|uniref:Uncharacterized protein n=1 Tax=Albula goreensis TaxID=1534307 RepID=A0A8T3DI48_9TELE|nr:hypothetical protein AGOR_G00096040 [Albula goreensis]
MNIMIPQLLIPAAFLVLYFSFIQCSEVSGILGPQGDLTPRDVRFHSLDYRNVLHWKTNILSSSELHFFVQYKIYGNKHWVNATHCQGIRELLCDLSNEMPEPREYYYARVQAALSGVHSPWVLSARFNPHWETSISPPRMKLEVTDQGIVVKLRMPYMRKNGSCNSMTKWQRLIYRIYVTCEDIVQEEHSLDGCMTEFLIKDLRPRTTYCLQAEALAQRLGRTSTKSKVSCITTL